MSNDKSLEFLELPYNYTELCNDQSASLSEGESCGDDCNTDAKPTKAKKTEIKKS